MHLATVLKLPIVGDALYGAATPSPELDSPSLRACHSDGGRAESRLENVKRKIDNDHPRTALCSSLCVLCGGGDPFSRDQRDPRGVCLHALSLGVALKSPADANSDFPPGRASLQGFAEEGGSAEGGRAPLVMRVPLPHWAKAWLA